MAVGSLRTAARDTQTTQHTGEAACIQRQFAVSALDVRLALGKEADRHLVGTRPRKMAKNGLVRDVEATSRQPVELRPRLIPGERTARRVVVDEVRLA